ncbi:MAG: outer membrane beta-barrel protein [Sandaracinaceae bacterium]|nr:outer membrane beta-barrel protein [Sandaracinaceae bacterium]
MVAIIGLTNSMKLVLNADLRFNPMLPGDTTDSLYFGASAALGIDVTDDIAIGARVEYLYGGSANGAYSTMGAESLITVTPTFRYTPGDNVILTLEPRLDWANEDISRPAMAWRTPTCPSTSSPVSPPASATEPNAPGVGYPGAWVKRALPVSSCWCSAGCCFSAPSPEAFSTPSSKEKTRVGLAWPTRRGPAPQPPQRRAMDEPGSASRRRAQTSPRTPRSSTGSWMPRARRAPISCPPGSRLLAASMPCARW